jgi:site-specific DNA recombinase
MAAAIYTRMSLDRTGEEDGVQRQLKECRELAESMGLNVLHELSDNDISATTGKRRPGFEELLTLAAADQVDTVVVWHTDRLYRKLKDLIRVIDSKVNIVTVRAGTLDLSTPAGRMVAQVLGAVASNEGEQRTDRQHSAYRQQRENGHWHFSRRPFGYTRQKGIELIPDIVPHEASVLRELWRRYYEGNESRYALVKDLNERGIKTAGGAKPWVLDGGKEWTITQLRQVLSNPRYAGLMPDGSKGNWTPIIEPEEFHKYVTASASRKALVTTFSREATSLMSGLIQCGVCGGKVYRRVRSDGKTYEYACAVKRCVSVGVKAVDRMATEAVVSALLFAPQNRIPKDQHGDDTNALGAAISGVQARRDELAQGVAAGLFKLANIAPQLEALNTEEATLIERREELIRTNVMADALAGITSDLFAGQRVSLDKAAEVKIQLRGRFDGLTLARQRELVRLLVNVTLHRGREPERVEIVHKSAESLNGPDEEPV